MVMVDGLRFSFFFWLYHFSPLRCPWCPMSAIYSLGCPDVFIWHNPVGSFIWADIMYLSASHIALLLSKYAIISSPLTLLNTSNHFQFHYSLRSRFSSPLISCCCATYVSPLPISIMFVYQNPILHLHRIHIDHMHVCFCFIYIRVTCTSTRCNPPVDHRLPG